MAERSLRVELADLDWLFFIPINQRTNSLMACTWQQSCTLIHTQITKRCCFQPDYLNTFYLSQHFRRNLLVSCPEPPIFVSHRLRGREGLFNMQFNHSYMLKAEHHINMLTLSFIRRSFTIKLATIDFMGDANWSGASIDMCPRETSGVMSCSGTSAFRLRDNGWKKTDRNACKKYFQADKKLPSCHYCNIHIIWQSKVSILRKMLLCT